MFKLSYINDTIEKISDAIASIMNMEVMICDSSLNRIGDSDKSWDPEYVVLSDTTSHMALALMSCEPYVLMDVHKSPRCQKCNYIETCNIEALIIVPIHYGTYVLGGIEVSANSQEKKEELVYKKDNIIDFIQKMADLIVSKLLEKKATDNMIIIREQLKTIIDSIDDAVIAIDSSGQTIYENIHADSILTMYTREYRFHIDNLIPRRLFIDLVKNGIPFKNKEMSLTVNDSKVPFLISGKPVKIEDGSIGAILTLKKLSDVVNDMNELSIGPAYTSFDDVLGESEQIKALKEEGEKVANSRSTILILGESGTGKEIFARAIHQSSNRKSKPFITINCAAIPDNLLESELFGYEDGAFTGARRGGKIGKFQLAEGGTIFLDEIGEMSINLQAKLLRVLQEKTIEKIGGQTVIDIDVRIIAATNRDLEKMIDAGEFREDLYYRLNVIPFHIPPLRERGEDVKILIYHFLNIYNAKLGKSIRGFSSEAEEILLSYTWRGNVRELQNAIEYAVNMETSPYIRLGSMPRRLMDNRPDLNVPEQLTIEEMERKMIETALKRYGDDVAGKTLAAQSLGIGIATLYRRLKHYGLK